MERRSLHALLLGPMIVSLLRAHEIEPVCALIEVDSDAATWVNGSPHGIDSSIVRECSLDSTLVVVPDFSVPATSFLDIAKRTAALGHPVKYMFPAGRRAFGELFGDEPISLCRRFTDRKPEPIPARGVVDPRPSVRIIRTPASPDMPSTIDRLVVSPNSSFGLVDEVAESLGAYAQPGGVQIVVESESGASDIRIRADDLFLAPPPILQRRPDGTLNREDIDEFESCLYPDYVKR